MSVDLPLISIIIPTYNRPDYILRACNTAHKQSYPNLEIIVVDDCSELSYQLQMEDMLALGVKYIKSKHNGGGSAARNAGIDVANGRYIAFLDDDDLWHQDKISKQYALLNDSIQAAQCGYTLKSSGKQRIEACDLITLDDLRINNKLASTTGLLCATALLKKHKFDTSLYRSQDWDLYLRLAEDTDFGYVQEPLYIYDDGDHTRMSNKFAQLTIAEYEKRLDMLKKHKGTLYSQAYERHVAELILPSLKKRKDKIQIINFCVREIGLLSTITQFLGLSARKVSR